MKAKCPQCGGLIDFVEHARSKELKEIIELSATFGRDSRLVLEYAELFSIAPLSLKTKKLLRLLWEIGQIYQYGKFSFQKKTYTISQPGVVEALKIVCNKRFNQPLENHNYLKKVLIGISEQETKTRSIEAEHALRAKEQKIMNRPNQPDPEKNLEGVRGLIRNIGGQI